MRGVIFLVVVVVAAVSAVSGASPSFHALENEVHDAFAPVSAAEPVTSFLADDENRDIQPEMWFYPQMYMGSVYPPPGQLQEEENDEDLAESQMALQMGAMRDLQRNGGKFDPDGTDPELAADPYQMTRGAGLSGARMQGGGRRSALIDPYQSQYSGEPVPVIPDNYKNMASAMFSPLCDNRISSSCGFQPSAQRLAVPKNTMADDDLRSNTGPFAPSHPADRLRWGQLNRMLPVSQSGFDQLAPGGMFDPMPMPTEPVPLANYIQDSRSWSSANGFYEGPQNAPGWSSGNLRTPPPNLGIHPDAPLGPAEVPS